MTAHLRLRGAGDESGFTLIEVMVTTLIIMTVSGVVITGVINMGQLNKTVVNRSSMFAGVRNATALLQQEVGQAGRIVMPASKLKANVTAGTATVPVTPGTTSGMFVGEQVIVGAGNPPTACAACLQETVAITDINGDTITATFLNDHLQDEPLSVQGAFSSGVVPSAKAGATTGLKLFDNGSTDTVLKIIGDINGTGSMVYVEYTCDIANGLLYRTQMPWTDGAKKKLDVDQILVENVQANPGGTPCFSYQERKVNNVPFVVNVAITLTVRSQEKDPVTKEYQKESKALLNVAPRNVFNAWQLASLDVDNRVHPLPPNVVTNLLPELMP
jgi:type II secretory pathway pseudopilin PulG